MTDDRAETASLTFVVTDDDTAVAVGSGDLPVLGTPRLLAWAEAATCHALRGRLGGDQTSVGTRVALEHLAPSAVGESITATATLSHQDGRLVRFEVALTDSSGLLVGHGEVTRVVVQRQRFLDRLAG